MAVFILVNGVKVKEMAMVFINGLTELSMKDSLLMIKDIFKAKCFIVMVQNMKVTGVKI